MDHEEGVRGALIGKALSVDTRLLITTKVFQVCSKNGSSPLKSFSLYQNNGVTGGDKKYLPVLEKANLPQKCRMSP